MDELGKHFYDFGPFRVDPSERVLLRGYEVVPLTPKAFEMLLVLLESSGHVLTKEELMKRVWPDTIVEEANLSHNIYKLREALGEGRNGEKYIETLPRRGYRFVAKVTEVQDEEPDLIIAEDLRAHIVIEEDDESKPSSETLRSRIADQSLQSSTVTEALAAAPIAHPARQRRQRRLAILVVAVLLVGSAASLFALYRSFKNNSGVKAEREMTITRVTNSGQTGIASISPDGKLVAYAQNFTRGNPNAGTGSLYVRQIGANHEVQLLDPGERIFGGTAFSPDSAFIYYVVYDKRDPRGVLYRIPALGGPPLRVLEDISSMFSVSPDGSRVSFYRYDPLQKQLSLMIAAVDGSGEQTLQTRAYNEVAVTGIPAWSPDGRMIAFVPDPALTKSSEKDETETISGIDIASGAVKPLTQEHWGFVGNMIWVPDGRGLILIASRVRTGNQLYYLSYPEGVVRRMTTGVQGFGNYALSITSDSSALVAATFETSAHLWTLGSDGDINHAIRLTTGDYDGKRGLAGLPDDRIVYVARQGGEYDLWTIKEDGTEASPLTADSFLDREISTTPDGRYLIFTSDRAGGSHIFRAERDGSRPAQLTFGEAQINMPNSSPDGQWVVYALSQNQKTTIWKVSIDGGTPMQLTDYECFAPSFSPDGSFISCIIPSETLTEKGSIAVIPASGGKPVKSFNVVPFSWSYLSARWTPDGQALIFRDSEIFVSNLWKQPLAGGPPSQLTNFKAELIFNYALMPNSQHLILSRGQTLSNVVLIKDFR